MGKETKTNGWSEWGKHVLIELENNVKAHTSIMTQLQQIHIDVATLKVKAGVWGALAGLVIAVPMLIIMLLKG